MDTMPSSVNSDTKESLRKRIMELEDTVGQLQDELKAARTPSRKPATPKTPLGRRIGIWLLVVLCSLSFVMSTAALWINRTVIDTDNWVKKTSEIIENPAIREEIATIITEQAFTQVDVESYIRSVLPERVSNLAAPLTNNLENGVKNTVINTLASDAFINFWTDANKSAHAGIMYSIENNGAVTDEIRRNNVIYIEDNQLVLSLHQVFVGLKKNLSQNGIPLLDSLSGDRITGQIALVNIPKMPLVLAAVNIVNQSAFLLPVASILFGSGAILLSRNKRRTMMAIAWVIIALMLLISATVNLAQYQIISSLSAIDSAAVSAGYTIITGSLLTISQTILILALLLVGAGFITGPSRPAAYVQGKLGNLTSSHGPSKLYVFISNNSSYIIGSVSVVAILLIIFPFSRAPAYLISVVSVAILIAFFVIAIKQAVPSNTSDN